MKYTSTVLTGNKKSETQIIIEIYFKQWLFEQRCRFYWATHSHLFEICPENSDYVGWAGEPLPKREKNDIMG